MKKSIYLSIVLFVSQTIMVSCVSVKAIYNPPLQEYSKTNYAKTINKSYNKVWESLINYSASTFFGIENFEKESGLLTLSFGSSNPSDYITGVIGKLILFTEQMNFILTVITLTICIVITMEI